MLSLVLDGIRERAKLFSEFKNVVIVTEDAPELNTVLVRNIARVSLRLHEVLIFSLRSLDEVLTLSLRLHAVRSFAFIRGCSTGWMDGRKLVSPALKEHRLILRTSGTGII